MIIQRLLELLLSTILILSVPFALFYSSVENEERIIFPIPIVTLHNGVKMPMLQFVAATNNISSSSSSNNDVKEECETFDSPDLISSFSKQFDTALQNGLRSFDFSESFDKTSYVLGEWFRTGRIQDRRELWITTTIRIPQNTSSAVDDEFMSSPESVSQGVRKRFEIAVKILNLGYVDLILLPNNWYSSSSSEPDSASHDKRQLQIAAWRVLEDVYSKGWARAIGVSNFTSEQMEHLKQDGAMILPMVNQIQLPGTIFELKQQYADVFNYCRENNIAAQLVHPLPPSLSSPGADGPTLQSNASDLLFKIAKNYGKGIEQVSVGHLFKVGFTVTSLSTSEETQEKLMSQLIPEIPSLYSSVDAGNHETPNSDKIDVSN